MVKIERNPVTGILEAFIPGTLTSIPSAESLKTNSNGKSFGRAEVEIVYPDGTKAPVKPIMYAGSIDTELFKLGDSVIVRTQLEGEYASQGVVELAGLGADLTKLAADIAAWHASNAGAKAPVAATV
jgi:hypothetical protein